jgi:hypothetical protein
MKGEAPCVTNDQGYLDAHAPGRAYWQFGYQTALQDILDLAERCSRQGHRNGDKSN